MTDKNKILDPGEAFVSPEGDAAQRQEQSSRPVSAYVSLDEALEALLQILAKSGSDTVAQLSGFLITDDPAYLPDNDEARAIARRLGRDKLLEALIGSYMENHNIGQQD